MRFIHIRQVEILRIAVRLYQSTALKILANIKGNLEPVVGFEPKKLIDFLIKEALYQFFIRKKFIMKVRYVSSK